MLITEILDSKIDYEVTEDTKYKFKCEATINDRVIELVATMRDKAKNSWEIVFAEKDDERERYSYGITGGGKELQVFAMVKRAILDLIKKHKPGLIMFDADKSRDTTRADLYERFLKRFNLPEYEFYRRPGSRVDYFDLIRIKK